MKIVLVLLSLLVFLIMGCQNNFYQALYQEMYGENYEKMSDVEKIVYNEQLLNLLYERMLIVAEELNKLTPPPDYGLIENQPVIEKVEDNFGNIFVWSWAKNNPNNKNVIKVKELKVGTVLILRAYVNTKEKVYYKLQVQPPSKSFITIQDWTENPVFFVTIGEELLGQGCCFMISISNKDKYNKLGFCDDYIYANYDIIP